MRRATQYMMDVASYKGGFVWNYMLDYSRQWGELEAYRTMVWLQSPSTPDVGQVLPVTMPTTSEDRSYAQQMVGDEFDTSPYPNQQVKGVSTRTYIWNMVILINSILTKH